jgi:hypothetical protein
MGVTRDRISVRGGAVKVDRDVQRKIFPEVGGGTGKYRAAQIGEPRLDSGIGEASVDLRVELVDDLSGRLLGGADALHRARLVAGSVSATVGTSGNTSERVAVVTAADVACPL